MQEILTLNPESTPDLSVIFLHGLGADGNDLYPIGQSLNIPNYSVRYLFPNAPVRRISLYMGNSMRAWYDLLGEKWGSENEDRQGLEDSRIFIENIIQREKQRGINSNRIILAGFSQGGALALYAGLRHASQLAGIIALSTYLPFADSTLKERQLENLDTPILFMHGLYDNVIPHTAAEFSRRHLNSLAYRIDARDYKVAHSIHPLQIQEMSAWIWQRMKALEASAVD